MKQTNQSVVAVLIGGHIEKGDSLPTNPAKNSDEWRHFYDTYFWPIPISSLISNFGTLFYTLFCTAKYNSVSNIGWTMIADVMCRPSWDKPLEVIPLIYGSEFSREHYRLFYSDLIYIFFRYRSN